MAPTSSTMSSSPHGLSRLLTRVQYCVSPKSFSFAVSITPRRAFTFSSCGIASSRLPSRMSTCGMMSGIRARWRSLWGEKKWIIREGRTGISRSGSGAPCASGRKKSRG